MENLINNTSSDLKIITPDDGYHYFFAYYDMRATQSGDTKHLCHRVPFMDRLPVAEDVCEIGYVGNGEFFKIGETTAWNFQQGAMLQYHPYLRDTVIYNVYEDGKFMTLTHNYVTGEKKYADRATACISPDGKWGLAVNFGRIYDFRPGYGYAGWKDEFADVKAPHEDGVFLVDMESGKSKQILFYDTLSPLAGFKKDDKVLVNHITFNTTSDLFVMLFRNFANGDGAWSTSLVVCDLEGNARTVLPNTYVSHYCFADSYHLVAHCTVGGVTSMFNIDLRDGSAENYYMPYFDLPGNPDIHCNVLPDGHYIIGDGYPKNRYRYLMAYNVQTGAEKELLRAKTDVPITNDIRCDLHSRYVYDNKFISFDTTHNGCRQIALLPIDVLDF